MDPNNNRGIPIYLLLILFLGTLLGVSVYWLTSGQSLDTSIPIIGDLFSTPNKPIRSLPTATPTPRPTGPGPYACSVLGSCKIWSPKVQAENCPTTFADNQCLDKCDDQLVRCQI